MSAGTANPTLLAAIQSYHGRSCLKATTTAAAAAAAIRTVAVCWQLFTGRIDKCKKLECADDGVVAGRYANTIHTQYYSLPAHIYKHYADPLRQCLCCAAASRYQLC